MFLNQQTTTTQLTGTWRRQDKHVHVNYVRMYKRHACGFAV